ncbi:MAG: 50S ribosomal protein L4 [Actinomycetota bacterium]|nr:50S ribosomal protein L4 [Actinomycetota bacterium]
MSTLVAPAGASLTLEVRTPTGGSDGTVDLPPELFDVPLNIPLIHQVVVAQQAAARRGTADTKNRSEVRGGGKKPWRQKGTGRGRAGSIRSPQFTGGGVSHGPTPRSYEQRTPKKMKAAALRSALSDRARNGRISVLSALIEGQVPSTKAALGALGELSGQRNLLVVVGRGDQPGWRSLRNLPEVHLLWADQLNTYDVLVSDELVFTREALQAFIDIALTRQRAPEPQIGATAIGPRLEETDDSEGGPA